MEKGPSPDEMDVMRETAEANLNADLPDLNLHFFLDLPTPSAIGSIIDQLNALDVIEYAATVPATWGLTSVPDDTAYQLVIKSHKVFGVDASWCWRAAGNGNGAHGEGIKFCDVELAFNLDHHDLPKNSDGTSRIIVLENGDPIVTGSDNSSHGTAQLGISLMQPNGAGGTGVAYAAIPYFSVIDGYGVAPALHRCLGDFGAGDVILISVGQPSTKNPRNGTYPADYNRDVFLEIQTLVGKGVTVVEGAGNNGDGSLPGSKGGINTDNLPGSANDYPFSPGNGSGAITVGAGVPPVDADPNYAMGNGNENPNSYTDLSNFGNAVVIQGHGYNVFAPTVNSSPDPVVSDTSDPNWAYTKNHAGTSSASAIVAGCCAVSQSAYLAFGGVGTLLTPSALRDLLVRTGTP